MRPIDADALLETMENFFIKAEDEARYSGIKNAKVTWNDAVYMIKTAPTIEVQPDIVHCSDCKYWHREIYNGIEYFNLSSCDLSHHGDGHNFYCADAKRREE